MESRRRRTKSGQAGPPNDDTKKKSTRYNLRKNDSVQEDVRWVDDDTLFDDVSDSDDSTYIEEDATTPTKIHGISVPSDIPVSVKIHLHTRVDDDEDEEYQDDDEEDDDEEEDDDDDEEEFIAQLLQQCLGGGGRGSRGTPFVLINDDQESSKSKKSKNVTEPPIKLFRKEKDYFEGLSRKQQKEWIEKMKKISGVIGETETPLKFQTLKLNTTPHIQAEIIRKIDTINRMGHESGESQKLRTWVDGILRVPFGKIIPLPVTIKDGKLKCAQFLTNARTEMDKATYGMNPAKMQIMQTLAQWVSNPDGIGNCIAMKGPPGVGKTAFARNGIAKVLNRPFMFFSLGGASDIAHYTGHSYTYEGSMWGRIVDSIMRAACMNPVLYFDELDKISGTPHGEEITSM